MKTELVQDEASSRLRNDSLRSVIIICTQSDQIVHNQQTSLLNHIKAFEMYMQVMKRC
jgi:hypothetical protein